MDGGTSWSKALEKSIKDFDIRGMLQEICDDGYKSYYDADTAGYAALLVEAQCMLADLKDLMKENAYDVMAEFLKMIEEYSGAANKAYFAAGIIDGIRFSNCIRAAGCEEIQRDLEQLPPLEW